MDFSRDVTRQFAEGAQQSSEAGLAGRITQTNPAKVPQKDRVRCDIPPDKPVSSLRYGRWLSVKDFAIITVRYNLDALMWKPCAQMRGNRFTDCYQRIRTAGGRPFEETLDHHMPPPLMANRLEAQAIPKILNKQSPALSGCTPSRNKAVQGTESAEHDTAPSLRKFRRNNIRCDRRCIDSPIPSGKALD
ncbi:hypothetical protein GCM10027297_33700 [Parahaliea aestuarii]